MKPTDLVVTRWGARFRGRRLPCAIGRGGLQRDKSEGDGATPVGVWRIVAAGVRAGRIAHPLGGRRGAIPLRAIGPGDIWSDDPADPAYNHLLRAPNHQFSHERLSRGDPLYDLVLMTNHNWPDAVPGAGSAIFLHRWRKPRHPTEGCVAFSTENLAWILRNWDRKSRLIVKG